MTLNTVVELLDVFFQVRCLNFLARVLVTPITRVLAKLATGVTSGALCVVVSVQGKVLVVIKSRRRPAILAMTLIAAVVDLPMNVVYRR